MKKEQSMETAELMPVAKCSPLAVSQKTMDANAMLAMALQGNASVEAIERIVALVNEERSAQARRDFFEALADFQLACPPIKKSHEVKRSGGQIMYRFASLSDIQVAIREPEHAAGLSHRWQFEPIQGGGQRVSCIITHKGGHSETTSIVIPTTRGQNTSAAQDAGAEATYGMRYTLLGGLGITTGMEDNDARAPCDSVDAAQLADLTEMCAATKTDPAKLAKWAGVNSLADFPAAKFTEAMATLRKRAGAK